MDPNFSFPRLPVPIPRPRPASKATAPPEADNTSSNNDRDSNALRASVLDVALQLGLGTNNAVANWMFNNSLEEEAEEVGMLSPLPIRCAGSFPPTRILAQPSFPLLPYSHPLISIVTYPFSAQVIPSSLSRPCSPSADSLTLSSVGSTFPGTHIRIYAFR